MSSRSSRTSATPMLSKERARFFSTRAHSSSTSSTGRGGGERRKSGMSNCLLCCARRPHGSHVADKDKRNVKGGTYSVADSVDKSNRESGISCLSQFSDIPRIDNGEGDGGMTSDHAFLPAKGKQSGSAQTSGQKCGRLTRKFVQVFFSFLGLTLLMVGHSIGGGFLFAYLEKDHEVKIYSDVVKTRTNAVDALWNTTLSLNVLHEEEWKGRAEETLKEFQREIYHLTTQGWVGADVSYNNTLKWNFVTSFLYSITVTTTIGYGNITPKTQLARILTVLYAIVGIPLCLLWLSTLGSYMAVGLRVLYFSLCRLCTWLCCGCCRKRRPPRRSREGRMEEGRRAVEGPGRPSTTATVPCYVSLLIICLYITLGAWLFSQWEGWTYLDAGYFCFITVSTIGFGDFVPGFDTFDKWKTIGNAAYLIIGLALVAMCFQLMQEDVKKSCQQFMNSIRSWTHGEQASAASRVRSRRAKSRSGEESEEEFIRITKEERQKMDKERKKAKREEEKSAKELKKKQTQEQREAQKATKKAKQAALKAKTKNQNSRGASVTSANSPQMAMACESPRYSQNPRRAVSTTSPNDTETSTAVKPSLGLHQSTDNKKPAEGCRRFSIEFQTSSAAQRPMSKEFQSMGALTFDHSEDEFETSALGLRGRVNTISGSLANQRYYDDVDCDGGGWGMGNKCLGGGNARPGTTNTTTNNNNTSRLTDLNQSEMMPRPMSVPPPAGLTDKLDLLEHMSWGRNTGCPPTQESPKMRRRDRSRSPVRGRPKSRGAHSEDRGGNVDVATEDEEEADENDDDDDDDDETLDAESVASSTDLIKVAESVRRERQQRPSPPASPISPSFPPTSSITPVPLPAAVASPSCTSPTLLPHASHPGTLSTFRPPPAGASACCPSGVSRPPSRCPSRTLSSSSSSSPLTFFHAGYDPLLPAASPPPPSYDVMSCFTGRPPGYDVMSTAAASSSSSGKENVGFSSPGKSSARPKDYDALSAPPSAQAKGYDVTSTTSSRAVSSASSRLSSAGEEEEEEEEKKSGREYGALSGHCERSSYPATRPPSSMGGRIQHPTSVLSNHNDLYGQAQWQQQHHHHQQQPQQQQQQQQRHKQQHRQNYQQHHPNQQQQQQQQQRQPQGYQNRGPPKETNNSKVCNSDVQLIARCVSPRPKGPKTPTHRSHTHPQSHPHPVVSQVISPDEEQSPPLHTSASVAANKTKKIPIGAF